MQRPTGVTVIAVLDFIGAAFCVIGGLLMFAGGAMLGSLFGAAATANGATGAAPAAGFMAGIGAAFGVVFLLFAVFAVFVAIGLLKLKNWARVTTIVLSGLGLLSTLSRFLHGFAGGGMVVTIVVLAYYVWVIWYMLQPNVKAAFGQVATA